MIEPNEPPPARGVRIDWDAVPARIRALIEERLGSAVVAATTQPEGFSPALAARVRTAEGRRAFIKAVPGDVNPDTPRIYRHEIDVLRRLPAGLPAPRLLWSIDEGDGGWVVIALEEIEGRHPAQPWRADELEAVVDALDDLVDRLTPSPVEEIRTAAHRIGRWQGWRQLAEAPPEDLDAWTARHLGDLAELEAAAPEAAVGTTLVHLDVRADNVLLGDGGVHFLDWPWACLGAPWIDSLLLSISVGMQGGATAPEAFALSRWGRAAEPAAFAPVLAAFAGMLAFHGRLPAPPGLPTLRPFQRGQERIAVAWLKRLIG